MPTILTPGTSFVEDNFSMDRGRGGGFGMIQELMWESNVTTDLARGKAQAVMQVSDSEQLQIQMKLCSLAGLSPPAVWPSFSQRVRDTRLTVYIIAHLQPFLPCLNIKLKYLCLCSQETSWPGPSVNGYSKEEWTHCLWSLARTRKYLK